MGLIRKTLFVGTGVVRPSSKKQRVAKKSLKAQRAQVKALRDIAKHSG
jgi:hypothetical protein